MSFLIHVHNPTDGQYADRSTWKKSDPEAVEVLMVDIGLTFPKAQAVGDWCRKAAKAKGDQTTTKDPEGLDVFILRVA